MAQFLTTEAFTAADATTLQSLTNWNKIGTGNDMQVLSNRLAAIAGATNFSAYYNSEGQAATPDYEVIATYGMDFPGADGPFIGGRINSANGQGYYVGWNSGAWRLCRFDSGINLTELANTATTPDPSVATRTVILRMTGAYIQVFVDGVEVYAVTDATYSAKGYAGVCSWYSDDDPDRFVDDLYARDYVFSASDAFTGNTSDPLQTYSTDWVEVSVGSGTDLLISAADKVYAAANAAWQGYIYKRNLPTSPDYAVKATFSVTNSAHVTPCIAGRVQSASSGDCYLVRYSNGDWQLYKVSGGTPSLIGSYTGDQPTTPRVVVLSMRGTAIEVLVDGVSRISVSDGTITAKGYAGLGSYFSDAFDGRNIDDWSAFGLVTIVTQPTPQKCAEGSTASFTLTATGTGTIHYQWKRQNPGGGSWSNVGTDAVPYTTGTAVRSSDSGALFKCTVSDDGGSLDSAIVEWTVTNAPAAFDGDGLVVGAGEVGADMVGAGPLASGVFNLSASDAASAGDSASASMTVSVSASDAASGGDSAQGALVIEAAASDAGSVGDSATQVPVLSVSASDAGSVGDSATQTPNMAVSATDAVSAGESATAAMTVATSASDAASAADSAASAIAVNASASDAGSVGDSATQVPVLSVSASDAGSVGDSTSQTPTLAASATDAVGAGESATAAMTVAASASDAASAADSTQGTLAVNASASDAGSVGDSATQVPVLSVSASDAVSVSDVASLLQVANALAIEAGAAADQASTLVVFSMSAADAVALLDAATAVLDTFEPDPARILEVLGELRQLFTRAEDRGLESQAENRSKTE